VSVRVLNTGATSNTFRQSCLREICFGAAVTNFDVKAKHIAGCENRIPVLLSRWDLNSKFRDDFCCLTKDLDIIEDDLHSSFFIFNHDW
jgi:hypothetical protein